MQINMWLHLSRSSLGNFLSRWFIKKNNRQQKCSFIATNNSTILAVWWSLKSLFLFQILCYSRKVMEKKWRKTIMKAFTFQTNAKKISLPILLCWLSPKLCNTFSNANTFFSTFVFLFSIFLNLQHIQCNTTPSKYSNFVSMGFTYRWRLSNQRLNKFDLTMTNFVNIKYVQHI